MYKYFMVFVWIVSGTTLLGQTLAGKVIDENSQKGVPFANVVLIDYHHGTRCDEQGNFLFTGTFPERVVLKVSTFGYETKLIEVQTDSLIIIALKEQHIDIEEVIVSASKNQLQRYNSTHVEMRSLDVLNAIPMTNLGQSLELIPGVYNSSTGNGISKPVIRGLQGTRVVSLLNGVRIENQQWGGDHGMGLTDLGIGTVEVIKGPASLLYGADALGGVIYYSDEAFAPQNSHELKVSSQFESNSMGTTNSLFYKGSRKGLRINVGGRFNSQADYQVPEGQFVKNSRFQESAGKIGIGWNKGKWISNVNYTFTSSRIGLPGHTHDSIITPDLFKSEEQLREKTLPVQYFTNHIASIDNKFVFKKSTLDVLVGGTYNLLQEFEDKVTKPFLDVTLGNIVYTVKMNSKLSERWSTVYGLQGMAQNQKNSDGADDRLLPNSNQFDNGIFSNFYLDLKKWKWQVGVRADLRVMTSEADLINFPNAYNKQFSGYNFALGGVYNFSKHTFRMNSSSGFRVPHLSELLSDGVHHGTMRYEIGNNELIPEKAVQLDVTYEYAGDHLSFILNPFVSYIADYIYISPIDSFIDGLQVFNYSQLNEAYLSGFDAGFHYHPHFAHFLHVESSFSYIRGTSSSEGNLALMPQPRISSSIIGRFSMKSVVKLTEVVLQHSYFLPQTHTSFVETSSVDYSLLNLGATFKISGKMPLQFQLGVRNLTNTKYINHLSRLKPLGLESPGRNFYVKLIITVNYDEKK